MYFIYADESGDSGLTPGGSDWFVISGIIVHESHWNATMKEIIDFRKYLKQKYGTPQRIAFHATEIVNGHGEFHHSRRGLVPRQRFLFYWDVMRFIARTNNIRVLNLCVKKRLIKNTDIDVFDTAWEYFIQRFQNSLSKGGPLNVANEHGVLITDRTHDDRLRKLLRRMRAYNPVPSRFGGHQSRSILVDRILDDPVPRASPHAYFVQLADMVAFALARKVFPRANLNQYNFPKFFDSLQSVLLIDANKEDPQGVVYWPK